MKKVLSFILAMVLVVGLIPAAFASDAPPAEGYTYMFTNAAHTKSASSGTNQCKFESNYRTYDGNHDLADTVESVSAPWGYVAQSIVEAGYQPSGLGTEGSVSRIAIRDLKETNRITFDPDGEGTAVAVCFEIEVEKGGEFVPTFTHGPLVSYGPILELYLAPKGETAPTNATLSDYVKSLDAKYRIGVVDTSLDDGSETYRPMTLSADNYYFILVLNGDGIKTGGTNTVSYCQPKSLALLPIQKTYTYDFTTNALVDGYAETINNELKNDSGLLSVLMPKVSAFVSPATVDTTKTSPWSVGNTRYVYNKIDSNLYGSISENGIRMFLTTLRYWALSNGDSVDSDNDNIKDTLPAIGVTAHTIFVLDVPAAGTYKLKMHNDVADEFGSYTRVSFGPAAKTKYSYGDITTLYKSANNNILGWHDSAVVHNGTNANPAEEFEVTVANAGKYYVLFTTAQESLDKNSTVAGANYQTLNLSKIVLEEVVDENAAQPGDEEVNVNPGNATAEEGKATISDEVSVLAKDTDGKVIENAVTKSESSATAEKAVGDYEFLYWAKGIGKNQKKVSTDLTYSFTNESEKLWLTAIYRNTTEKATKATFYNANGDIISTVAIADGKVTTPALTNVSLAGYGEVAGWKYAADGVTYGENQEVTVSGDALFVAEYDEPNTSIDITVKNGTMVVEGEKAFPVFGDKVTVTAPARKDNTKLFNYWMKDGEIVSFEKTYTFVAWKECTLEAVYTDYVPLAESVRKIILGNDGNTYVAEFIGFDGADVLERGIAFATEGNASYASINRVVMNRKDLNHLAAIDDIDAKSVVGYVIDKDGNIYYSK